jgi:alpha-1,2-mannosyltransferase
MAAVEPLELPAAARWGLAARRAGTHSLLVWPPVAVGWVLVVGIRKHAMAFDFAHAYLPAARMVLAGHSPYPPATVAALTPRTAFLYPPLTAYLAAPFTALPTFAAEVLASLLAISCVVGVLALLRVRDWRCYMVAFLFVPTYSAIQTANVMLLLALGLALLWRYRDGRIVAPLLLGALIAVKLILWPLIVWLVVTRRFRPAAGSLVAGAVLVFAPWAAIGFAGLSGYPHLLGTVSRVQGRDGFSIEALLTHAVSWRTAELVGYAIGAVVLASAGWIGRHDERRSFALAIAAALLLTPIVEMDYFVLLLVVLALYKPRLGWAWIVPLAFWVAPQVGRGAAWQTAIALAAATASFAIAFRRTTTGGAGAQPSLPAAHGALAGSP